MKRISKESEQQFIESFDALSDALFRHSFFRVSNREVALDLTQETFTKTWNHLLKGEDVNNMKAFLYQVMNNLIIDYYRKHKSESLDTLIDDGFDPSDENHKTIVHDAEIGEIKKILLDIPEKDRNVVVLRYIDGLTVKEIAELEGETENGISVRLHRALEKVRVKLKP